MIYKQTVLDMENENKTGNRKKFILWGAGILSFFAIKKFAINKTEKKKEMVKMLTADGKLVEVDKAILDKVTKSQKSTNKDIYNWMKNPSKDNS